MSRLPGQNTLKIEIDYVEDGCGVQEKYGKIKLFAKTRTNTHTHTPTPINNALHENYLLGFEGNVDVGQM